MDLSDSDAEALVTTLQDKRRSGANDLELITWLSNKYRIGQSESRPLYDDFYRGFQQGADSVIPVIDGRAAEPAGPTVGNSVYRAAYRLGQWSFTEEYARSIARHQPRGCLGLVGLVFLLLFVPIGALVFRFAVPAA